ncbi:unnamed protein product [Ranitomeya imitator]|uniref:Reverse transcriptase domain-containing protein n=1 Tax=Ranitomeya imitator TaxID=111125 RepID=A0ABN9LVZ0_9NEOB|nr:unnamed protein product [Ranitomeya imitator]
MSRSIHQFDIAPHTVQELTDALIQVSEEIALENIRRLFMSMPKYHKEVFVLKMDQPTAITETAQKITSIEEQLGSTLSSTEWQSLKTKTDKIIEDHRKALQDKKRSKFQRDSDDYIQDRKRPPTRSRGHHTGGDEQGGPPANTADRMITRSQITNISPDCILATFDVKSLYTSIEHDLGITAVSELLQTSNLGDNSTQLCLDLLSIVLRENYFLFGDQFYLQTRGTAMGANMSPAYANIYMDNFEQSYVYTNALFQQYSKCWLRFIDDIFCLWVGTPEDLLFFTEVLNSIRSELQFTLNWHMTQIFFLDTLVIKNDKGTLSTDIFTKPTDTNNLLHYTSCHPSSTKKQLASFPVYTNHEDSVGD